MLKVRTLFSGIGSPERALKDLRIPYELIDFCEVDKYAIKSYCAVHGVSEEKNLGDITKVWRRNLPYADLLIWGFPCQDISVAGKQKGLREGETRSGLYYEGFRILKETKPKYSIIENVKNLVGKKFKTDFESMLDDIESIGYNNYWQVLNAKDYGIPQNRERVFIVSIRKDVDNGTFEFPKGFDNGLRLKDFLENEVDEKYYISHEKTEKLIQNLKDERIMSKLPGGDELKIIGTTQNVRLGGIFDGRTKHQAGSVWDKNGICPTLDTMQGGYRQPSVIVREATKKGYAIANMGDSINLEQPNSKTRRGRVGKQVAQTLTCSCNQATLVNNYRIRKLTPKECWRLMGFKDEDFQKAADSGVSNSQLYKQAGNSIVTNCLFYIFKNLLQTEIAAMYEDNKELS